MRTAATASVPSVRGDRRAATKPPSWRVAASSTRQKSRLHTTRWAMISSGAAGSRSRKYRASRPRGRTRRHRAAGPSGPSGRVRRGPCSTARVPRRRTVRRGRTGRRGAGVPVPGGGPARGGWVTAPLYGGAPTRGFRTWSVGLYRWLARTAGAAPGAASWRATTPHGRLPERPKGSDCKSDGSAFGVRIPHLPPERRGVTHGWRPSSCRSGAWGVPVRASSGTVRRPGNSGTTPISLGAVFRVEFSALPR